jgi:hypothetical protein
MRNKAFRVEETDRVGLNQQSRIADWSSVDEAVSHLAILTLGLIVSCLVEEII